MGNVTARPLVFSLAEVGSTPWKPMDWRSPNAKISIQCVVTGTVNYDIEHTLDDVQDPDITPTAFDHETLVAQTVSADGNYFFPIMALRLTINSGTGSVVVTVLQS